MLNGTDDGPRQSISCRDIVAIERSADLEKIGVWNKKFGKLCSAVLAETHPVYLEIIVSNQIAT
jgi:hypothetical protein